jgi:hypothetical protein
MRSKLKHLLHTLIIADKAVIEELKFLYPEGSAVRAIIMSGQVNPSRGCVIGHRGGTHAYVTVRLESRTNEVRDIPADMIVGRT